MKIFISSTYIDLIDYRKAVETAVNKLNVQHRMMEYFGSQPEEPKTVALKEVEGCDILIGVYAHRYGTIPKGDKKSVTEQEFDRAKELGKPIFVYCVEPDIPWPPKMIERGSGVKKLAAFKKRMDKYLRSEFKDPTDLAFKVGTDLGNSLRDHHPTMGSKESSLNVAGNHAEIYHRYIEYLISQLDKIDATQIAKPLERTLHKIALTDVYVPLRGSVAVPEHDVYKRGAHVAGRKLGDIVGLKDMPQPEQERSATMPLHEALAKHAGLVILGDPGSGKTTFLKYAAVAFAQNEQMLRLGMAEARVPVFLPIAAYAECLREEKHHLALMDYFERYCHDICGLEDEIALLIRNALEEGNAIVMLDGLDEVKEAHERGRVAKQVERFWERYQKRGNRLVITSRIIGYNRLTAPKLTHLTVHDFDNDGIRLFLEKWCPLIESAVEEDPTVIVRNAAREKRELEEAIFHGPADVRELAANPLLLTLLALIKRKGVHLPQQRVELYEQYVEALVEKWALHRNPDRILTQTRRYGETERILAALALWMREKNPEAGVVDQPAVEDWLTNNAAPNTAPALARAAAHTFLNDLRNDCGLIVERGHRQYGFLHQTLEEYLAAKGLCYISGTDISPLLNEIRRNHMLSLDIWRETILLAVGHLSVIQRSPDRAAQLIEGILQEVLSSEAQGLNVVRAGEALRDVGRSGVTETAWQVTLEALKATMIDVAVPAATRRNAGLLLVDLGWFPDGDEAITVFEKIPSGIFLYGNKKVKRDIRYDFWIGKYPVTNFQFKEFMEGNGYSEPKKPKPLWWSESGWKLRINNNWNCPDYWDDRRFNNALQPVVGVSWYEADAYCRWLTLTRDDGFEYRLPTEEEWEKAARGEKGRIYPWGSDFDEKYTNTRESELRATTPVMMFPDGQSEYKVFDLAGNVWEWTNSLLTEKEPYQVLRGGSWDDILDFARCAGRNWIYPYGRNSYVGFRCTRTKK